jgi:hypothetical protein
LFLSGLAILDLDLTPTDSGSALNSTRAFACNISANFRIRFHQDSFVGVEEF